MNYRKVYKSAAVLTLSAVIAGTSAVTIPAAEKNTEKEENVYVNLKEDGSVDYDKELEALEQKTGQWTESMW